MINESNKDNSPHVRTGHRKRISHEGYPSSPPNEDIYNRSHKVENKDTVRMDSFGDGGKKEKIYDSNGVEINNEKGFEDDVSGGDLDIPGSELDNDQERIGSEDEENNYYSIGGDRHDDLDEDRGE